MGALGGDISVMSSNPAGIGIWYPEIGCLIAWAIWFVMFIQLLIDRHKRES